MSLIPEAPPHSRLRHQVHTGPDLTVHAETAYDHGVPGHGVPVTASASPSASASASASASSVPSAQKVSRQA
ncbi:hypothetical protein FPZ41_29435 [Streptomyces sp. K1PN6]|uniref:Uncharacterized protein n=1 Tax=Streptomyces acidicola TaxID=2596892 RepID=A0A5N8WYL9_9ACTN|nr:hypothetical protein [Streptomyces acidicola]